MGEATSNLSRNSPPEYLTQYIRLSLSKVVLTYGLLALLSNSYLSFGSPVSPESISSVRSPVVNLQNTQLLTLQQLLHLQLDKSLSICLISFIPIGM